MISQTVTFRPANPVGKSASAPAPAPAKGPATGPTNSTGDRLGSTVGWESLSLVPKWDTKFRSHVVDLTPDQPQKAAKMDDQSIDQIIAKQTGGRSAHWVEETSHGFLLA